MGQTDKQFSGFLRLVISQLKKAIAEKDAEAKNVILTELLDNLQNTLEEKTKRVSVRRWWSQQTPQYARILFDVLAL